MARIVPPGSPVNMGIEDPLDRLVKTVDLATKVGSFLQTSADRKSQNHMQDLESAINMMQAGSQFLNVETAEKFQNQINIITEDAMNSGDSTLQMAAQIANQASQGAVDTANNFNAAYMSFGELKNDPIFNIKNYTVIGEDGKSTLNKEFINGINNMGVDKWNNYVTQIDSLKSQLFNQGEGGVLIPKIKNHKGAQGLESEWNTVQNMWLNLRDSADMNDQISNEEFKYMVSKGGLTNKELDLLREDIVGREKQNIGNYSRNISQSSNAILSLTQKKDKTIRQLMEEDDDIANYLFESLSQNELKNTIDSIGDIPIAQLEVGGTLDGDANFIPGPEGAQKVYEKLLKDLKISKSSYSDLQERSINRFDFWSPTSWDAEIGGIETDGSGSNTRFKNQPEAYMPVSDTFIEKDSSIDEEIDKDDDSLSDYIDIDSSPSEDYINVMKMEKSLKEKEKLEGQLKYQNNKLQYIVFDENVDNPKTAGARGYNKQQIKFINFSLGKGLSLDPIKYSDPKFQEFLKDYKQYNQHKSDFEDVKKALIGGDPAKWLSEKLGRTPGGKSEKNKLLKATYKARKKQMEVFKNRWNTEVHGTIAAMEWLLNSSEGFKDTLNNIGLIEEKINKLK